MAELKDIEEKYFKNKSEIKELEKENSRLIADALKFCKFEMNDVVLFTPQGEEKEVPCLISGRYVRQYFLPENTLYFSYLLVRKPEGGEKNTYEDIIWDEVSEDGIRLQEERS